MTAVLVVLMMAWTGVKMRMRTGRVVDEEQGSVEEVWGVMDRMDKAIDTCVI